jgi:hypothetical protein
MGCTFPCNFCSCQKFSQRRFIARSPELVVEDLSRIEQDFVMFCGDHSFIDIDAWNVCTIDRQARHPQATSLTPAPIAWCRIRRCLRSGRASVGTGDDGWKPSMTPTSTRSTSAAASHQRARDRDLLKNGIALSAGLMVMPDYRG